MRAESSRLGRGESRREAWSRFGPWRLTLWLPLAFLAALGLAAALRKIPPVIPIIYLVASAVTYGMYAFDKRKAQRDEWRTPESTLHFLGFFGGWPGGWIARRQFRHKTAKLSFRIVFWLCVALHFLLWGWILVKVPGEAEFDRFVAALWQTGKDAITQ